MLTVAAKVGPTDIHIQSHQPRTPPPSPSARGLLQTTQGGGDLAAHYPFSWTRGAVALVSYALLLTDVIRTGLGYQSFAEYATLEPDAVLYFGPYAYPGIFLTTDNATMTQATDYWLYKYDTTSIGMRAIAQSRPSPIWPSCVTYQEACDESEGVPTAVVFEMFDRLVQSVADQQPSEHNRIPGHVSVRAKVNWFDRLYHYALPWFFQRFARRSVQAIHYNHHQLQDPHKRLCQAPLPPRPYSCHETWTNYRLSCRSKSCRSVDTVWRHINRRLDAFRAMYANHTVELLVVDSAEDFARPGIAYQGRKGVDVVSLIRIRDCDGHGCKTIAIDDYRYEAAWLTSSAVTWYPIISTLRALGQGYSWLRLTMLFVGCFAAQEKDRASSQLPLTSRLWRTVRTLLLVPSQVIIYGAFFPILCYAIAHLLDSGVVYELATRKFRSLLGDFNFNITDVVTVCSVAMRSVWAAAVTCHAVHILWNRRRWSLSAGIVGVPEYSISFGASITVFAQIRRTTWRKAKVLEAYDVASSLALCRLRTSNFNSTRGFTFTLVTGSTVDAQCLICSSLLIVTVFALSRLCTKTVTKWLKSPFRFFGRTNVPLSAGSLWPANSFVVMWHRDIARVNRKTYPTERMLGKRPPSPQHHGSSPKPSPRKVPTAARKRSEKFSGIHRRSAMEESTVYLMNLAMMTEPFTFLRLRILSGEDLGLYVTRETERRVLLPRSLAASEADIAIDWGQLRLVRVVNTKDIAWRELLQCG